jgi:hypothetical protein
VTSPRQAALGGKTITIYDDDVNQVNFNPAINVVDPFGVIMVVIVEMTYGTASYAYTYDRHLQTFQVGGIM